MRLVCGRGFRQGSEHGHFEKTGAENAHQASENEYDAIIIPSHKLRIATVWTGSSAKTCVSATDDIGVRSSFSG